MTIGTNLVQSIIFTCTYLIVYNIAINKQGQEELNTTAIKYIQIFMWLLLEVVWTKIETISWDTASPWAEKSNLY